MLDFIGMWEQAKQELEGMWASLDTAKSAAQASDAIKRYSGTPENANMVEAIEKSRKGAEPVLLAPAPIPEPAPVSQELDLFEDTAAEEEGIVPTEALSPLAPQGFDPEASSKEVEESLDPSSSSSLEGAIKSMVFDVVKHEENGIRENWNKETKKWLPHSSEEGGTTTIAYGHKFATQAEADVVTAKGGITETEAVEWFKEDMKTAEGRAKKEYEAEYPTKKWGSLDALGKLMLTEVVFNIGTLKKLNKKTNVREYDWPLLSEAVQDKDYKVAKDQLSRKYTKPDGTEVSLVARTNALKEVYAKALPLTDWSS